MKREVRFVWSTRCVAANGCNKLQPVTKVKGYDFYPPRKEQPVYRAPDEAHIVKADLACGHSSSFISTWRQLVPHISSIGASA